MTHHLSHDEFVAAMEQELDPLRQAHLDGCPSCRATLDELHLALTAVETSSALPEPSPLFWDHLSARIREATHDELPGASIPWWREHWRPMVASTATAVLVIVGAWHMFTPAARVPTGMASSAFRDTALDVEADDGAWLTVGELTASLSSDDVRWVVAPGPMASSAVAELTPREREAFVKLLDVELERGE